MSGRPERPVFMWQGSQIQVLIFIMACRLGS
uniref:Uncharacterized protein n=1 Tax=Caudovirales sp. ctUJJ3 TaxID=2826777 RepID=A0A8S5NFQ0_9CAUD|nr:MAG TPA: hypothetical protein [Caudovirales sp. ctUJJ3]